MKAVMLSEGEAFAGFRCIHLGAILWGRYHYHPHATFETTETQGGQYQPKVRELAKGRAQTQTRGSLALELCALTHCAMEDTKHRAKKPNKAEAG